MNPVGDGTLKRSAGQKELHHGDTVLCLDVAPAPTLSQMFLFLEKWL